LTAQQRNQRHDHGEGGKPEPLQHVALVRAVVEWRRLEAARPCRKPWRRRGEEEDAHHGVGQFTPQRLQFQFLPRGAPIARQRLTSSRSQREGAPDAGNRLLPILVQRVQLWHRDPVAGREESAHHQQCGIAMGVPQGSHHHDARCPAQRLTTEQHVVRMVEGAACGDAPVGQGDVSGRREIHRCLGACLPRRRIAGTPGLQPGTLPHSEPSAGGGDKEHQGYE